jgi:5-methylthioadenosine/S-adenosylhomocysteine deaminase
MTYNEAAVMDGTQIDILIHNGAVLTAEGWLTPGYVTLNGGTIVQAAAGSPPPDMLAAAGSVIDARHMAVLPGLTNGHTHLSQTFMRGLAGGRPLLSWLKELIWPLQTALTPEVLRLAALLGLVENLRCGTTTLINHHKVAHTPAHTDAVLDAASGIGLRMTLARSWADRGTNAESPDSILDDLRRLFAHWDRHTHIRIANGPLVPWRCSGDTLQRTHALAQDHHAPTHIHVSETAEEVRMTQEETDLRPVAWLDALGILGTETHIVHSVWVDAAEIALMAARDALVVHCPVSNTVLGSGIAPLVDLQRAGVRLRLGTDGPASNDTQDTFETLKQALCLARAATLDPTVITPADVLAMALDGRVLASGDPADVILVNLNHSRAVPVHDPTAALALSTHGSDVDTVIVDGRVLMQGGHVAMLDEAALLDECRAAVHILRKQAGLA